MTGAWQAQSAGMLRAPWQWRRNDGSLWGLRVYGVLTVLLFGLPAAAALRWMPPPAAWTTVGALLLGLLTLAFAAQIAALLRLDHPHAARTVPGHARALRRTAAGLWASLVALGGALAAPGAALLFDTDLQTSLHIGLATALGTGTVLLFLAAALRWWWLWIPACVGPSFIGVRVWRNVLFDLGNPLLQAWQAQPLATTLLVLAAQGLLLGTVFGRGDAAHARAYASRETMRRAAALDAAGQRPGLAAYGRWGAWLGRPLQAVADAWLRRCLTRSQPSRASVMARGELVLFGVQHWVRQLASIVLVQVFVGLCLVTTASMTGLTVATLVDHGRLGIGLGLGFMAFSAVLTLPGALWASRREQALLLLLPGMPRGATLNHALAWRQWRQCLVLWLALLPAFGLLLWTRQPPHALVFLGTALPLSAWMWRDHARMPAGRPVPVLWMVVVCALANVLSMWLLSRMPGALWPWTLGLLALTAALLGWRWHRLGQLPQALPVGRLS